VCERPAKGGKAVEREAISSTKSRRAGHSMVTFLPGSTCCGFMSSNRGEKCAKESRKCRAFFYLGVTALDRGIRFDKAWKNDDHCAPANDHNFRIALDAGRNSGRLTRRCLVGSNGHRESHRPPDWLKLVILRVDGWWSSVSGIPSIGVSGRVGKLLHKIFTVFSTATSEPP
jgi:hypothetical protein